MRMNRCGGCTLKRSTSTRNVGLFSMHLISLLVRERCVYLSGLFVLVATHLQDWALGRGRMRRREKCPCHVMTLP